MADIYTFVWIAILVVLFVIAVLFLIGALSVERTLPDKDKDCICKQTRFAVYANIDCPVHGERP